MSQELLEIYKKCNNEDIVMKLVMECAPLLSRLRAANIINITRKEFMALKRILRGTEITFYLVAACGDKLSMILYRESVMRSYMLQPEVKKLLKKVGYPDDDSIYELLYRFSLKYKNFMEGKGEFPHEMGLFLGYPVEDVLGYIDNDGKNFLTIGYWKVYKNKREKTMLFKKFEEAKEVMITLISYGLNIKEVINIFSSQRNALEI